MIYIDYAQAKEKYEQALKSYNELLDEKQQLFIKTQPQGIDYKKDLVNHSVGSNMYDMYLIALERSKIDERLKECNIITNERKSLLDLLEGKLKASNNINDKIYRMFYLDGLSLTSISARINYSRAQVWRLLNNIKKNI